MILRHREKETLDALEDLVRFLGGVREERKAVIAITDGWRLYERNGALARPIDGQVPTGPVIASIHEKRDEFRELLQGAVEEGRTSRGVRAKASSLKKVSP